MKTASFCNTNLPERTGAMSCKVVVTTPKWGSKKWIKQSPLAYLFAIQLQHDPTPHKFALLSSSTYLSSLSFSQLSSSKAWDTHAHMATMVNLMACHCRFAVAPTNTQRNAKHMTCLHESHASRVSATWCWHTYSIYRGLSVFSSLSFYSESALSSTKGCLHPKSTLYWWECGWKKWECWSFVKSVFSVFLFNRHKLMSQSWG